MRFKIQDSRFKNTKGAVAAARKSYLVNRESPRTHSFLSTINYQLSTGPRGFTVLYAALVASLLLAVGLTIFDITYKEVVFSAVARDSNFAFYAADTGIECALYWDFKYTGTANAHSGSVFATSTNSAPPSSGVDCNNLDIAAAGGPPPPASPSPWIVTKSAASATTEFWVTFSPQAYCVDVTVAKSGTTNIATRVTANGYNTCSQSDQTRIERSLQTNY